VRVHGLQIYAAIEIEKAEHQEDPEKQKARQRDHCLDRLIVTQVHEKQRDQSSLDGGDQERDHHVSGAEIDIEAATVMAVRISNAIRVRKNTPS
jgi:hypothetical protein